MARRLWPDLRLVLANGTGAFAHYAMRLRSGEGAGVPILSTILAASEGLMGISLAGETAQPQRLTEDGKVYRRGRKRYPNGDVYEGEFVDGKREARASRARTLSGNTRGPRDSRCLRVAACCRMRRATSTSASSKRICSTVRRARSLSLKRATRRARRRARLTTRRAQASVCTRGQSSATRIWRSFGGGARARFRELSGACG